MEVHFMKKTIFSIVMITSLFANAGEQGQRKTAATGIDEYQSDVCGQLNRIRYEDQGSVIKLLVDNINVKFSKSVINADAVMLATALTNKKIKVCYYQKGVRNFPMLDFYFDETEK
jgi:hypothetical protein